MKTESIIFWVAVVVLALSVIADSAALAISTGVIAWLLLRNQK